MTKTPKTVTLNSSHGYVEMPVIVRKLEYPVQSGDWHDKPLRWEATAGSKRQMFSTKKDAMRYRRIWLKTNDELGAIKAYQKD